MAKGVPFREAHHIVGEAVVEAIRQGKPLEDYRSRVAEIQPVIGEDVYPILSLQSCLDKRAAKGGVSPQQVAQAIAFAQARLGNLFICSPENGELTTPTKCDTS